MHRCMRGFCIGFAFAVLATTSGTGYAVSADGPLRTVSFTVAEDGKLIQSSAGLRMKAFVFGSGYGYSLQPKPGTFESEPVHRIDVVRAAKALTSENPERDFPYYRETGLPAFQIVGFLRRFPHSGPYRRVVSKPGYTYVDGDVFLPCHAFHLIPGHEEGYVYVGGWGAGERGSAVDAGFQHSSQYDDYSVMVVAQRNGQSSENWRLQCGQEAHFQFYVVPDGTLHMVAAGVAETFDGSRMRAVGRQKITAKIKQPTNWPIDGGGANSGIVMKRMTTIAQKDMPKFPPGVTWENDGSYFGHAEGSREPLVRWRNIRIGNVDLDGRLPADPPPWGQDQTYANSSDPGVYNYPNEQSLPHNCFGNSGIGAGACADEAIAVDLTGPKRK